MVSIPLLTNHQCTIRHEPPHVPLCAVRRHLRCHLRLPPPPPPQRLRRLALRHPRLLPTQLDIAGQTRRRRSNFTRTIIRRLGRPGREKEALEEEGFECCVVLLLYYSSDFFAPPWVGSTRSAFFWFTGVVGGSAFAVNAVHHG